MIQRQIDQYLWDPELIGRKMIFLSGPRQVGKTTFAKSVLERRGGSYFNWDVPETRRAYRDNSFFFLSSGSPPGLVVFDEIHKQKNWKNILKGIYDGLSTETRLLITGSARLEWFRKSGDSLIGRYSHFHLYPFSLSELIGIPLDKQWLCSEQDYQDPPGAIRSRLEGIEQSATANDAMESLLAFGGFPEPLFASSARFHTKWKRDYRSLLLTEDLRELTNIKDLDRMERLADLLLGRIGAPLSINSLSGDLETSFATVKSSIGQFERLWLLFSVKPYSRRVNRSVKKERKVYFVNWSFVEDEGARFENLLAVHLQRACTIWNDMGFADTALWYVRNFDGREIDFVITINKKPVICIESKLTEDRLSLPHRNLAHAIGAPIIQVVRQAGIMRKESEDAIVVSADRFLRALP